MSNGAKINHVSNILNVSSDSKRYQNQLQQAQCDSNPSLYVDYRLISLDFTFYNTF